MEAIKSWPIPTNVKELQSFLGTINYLSKFIPHLSTLRSTLQNLVKKDSEYIYGLPLMTGVFKTLRMLYALKPFSLTLTVMPYLDSQIITLRGGMLRKSND